MAVKVVYDATRGLVQENDTTGAGGFEIKDAILSEGVEGAADPIAATDPATELSLTLGVSLVKTTAAEASGIVSVPNAEASNVGQIKTVIYKAENAAGDTLTVSANGLGAGVTLNDVGDVLMLMWNGSAWNIVGQTA